MKTYFYTFLFSLLFSFSIFAQGKFELGVNLVNDGAFVNIMNTNSGYSNVKSYDSLGWAQSDFDLLLMDGRPVAEWTGTIDDPEKNRINYSGRYKSCFNGLAIVSAKWSTCVIENISYDSVSNTTFFDVIVGGYPDANHGMVFLNFKDTRRSPKDTLNSGITNLKVNRPGYELNSTKIFTDEYINLCKAADFACYRYYGVQNIWDGEPVYPQKTLWSMRKTPVDATQISMANMNGKKDGWCWEYIIELANILKKDIWINIHQSCDSIYVSNLAKLLKAKLDPKINIYVENSNEVWSPTQATHGPYNKSEADFYKITFDQNYARRTVELSRWFAGVFGKDEIHKKIRVILAGQESYNGRSDTHLNYIKNAIGEPNEYIYATSTALYFGSTQSSSADLSLINNGMMEDISNQISKPSNSDYRLNHINKAKNWNLPGGCTSYEGGPGIPSGGSTSNIASLIFANRTEKMKDILKYSYLEGWKNIGGGLAMYFTLASGYNRYGCWGITDDYTKPDRNYKMQAMREIIFENHNDVKEINENDFQISPNPADDFIEIFVGVQGTVHYHDIHIFNVFGEIVKNPTPTISEGQGIRIDLSGLPSGVYFVRIGDKVGKFVKI